MAESELMRELHSNLWASLRHVFNTDRVLLGVLYLTNFAGFVMPASVSRNEPIAALATVVAMVLLDTLDRSLPKQQQARGLSSHEHANRYLQGSWIGEIF